MHIRPINPVCVSAKKSRSYGLKREDGKWKGKLGTPARLPLQQFSAQIPKTQPVVSFPSPCCCLFPSVLKAERQDKRMIKCHNQFQFGARIELR